MNMNWLDTFNEWLDLIIKHYGSLEEFDDISTIEHQIRYTNLYLLDQRAFLGDLEILEQGQPKGYVEPLRPETEANIKAAEKIEKMLADWKKNKGL